jgi:hypothetical protein
MAQTKGPPDREQCEGLETVLWIRIRIRFDPKLLAGSGYGYGSGKKIIPDPDLGSSGSKMKKTNYSEELINFIYKNALSKNINSFLSKTFPKQSYILS